MPYKINPHTGKLDYYEQGQSGIGTPGNSVVSQTSFGLAPSIGAASEYSRRDHAHGTPNNPATDHIAGTNNPHSVTKTQVGLGNCDNTSDVNKPVSTAQQTALDGKIGHSLATAVSDFLVASGVGVFVKKTLAEVKTILGLGSAAYLDVGTGATQVAQGNHTHPGGSEAFPVGAVFIAVVSTSPATLLGYGTWSAFGAGRVLVGLDPGDTDFDTAEEIGGAKTVQSSAQTFAGSALATHQHDAISAGTPAGTVAAIAQTATAAVKIGTGASNAAAQSHTHAAPAFTGSPMGTHQHASKSAGTPAGTNTPGAATSVVQPYIVVYMWKRTA